MVAEARDPVGETIAQKEERREPGKPCQRQLPGASIGRPYGQATAYQEPRPSRFLESGRYEDQECVMGSISNVPNGILTLRRPLVPPAAVPPEAQVLQDLENILQSASPSDAVVLSLCRTSTSAGRWNIRTALRRAHRVARSRPRVYRRRTSPKLRRTSLRPLPSAGAVQPAIQPLYPSPRVTRAR